MSCCHGPRHTLHWIIFSIVRSFSSSLPILDFLFTDQINNTFVIFFYIVFLIMLMATIERTCTEFILPRGFGYTSALYLRSLFAFTIFAFNPYHISLLSHFYSWVSSNTLHLILKDSNVSFSQTRGTFPFRISKRLVIMFLPILYFALLVKWTFSSLELNCWLKKRFVQFNPISSSL